MNAYFITTLLTVSLVSSPSRHLSCCTFLSFGHIAPYSHPFQARTRRILHADAEWDQEDQLSRRAERNAAASELRRAELISLAALVLSPLAGSWLLTWLMETFTDGNRYLNKFNIRLFMLASGIRPWSHALSLFRQRLLHLQEVVHYPSSKFETLQRRVIRLESDLSTMRKLVAMKTDVSLLREGIDLPLTQLSRSMRRYEKKEEHLRMSAEDKFSLIESRLEDLLRETAINAELIEEERHERQHAVSLPASIFQAIRLALGQRSHERPNRYDAPRTLPPHASLGIAAPPDKSANSSLSQTSSSDSLTGYGSPPRYGPVAPTTTSCVPLDQPSWTEEGLAYWVFLPINLPRSVLRTAMSLANGRYNAARDANYAHSYAAISSNPSNPPSSQHHRLPASSRSRTFASSPTELRPPAPSTTASHLTRRV